MSKIINRAAAIVFLLVFLFVYKTYAEVYTADVFYEKGQDLLGERDFDMAYKYATRAVRNNPLEPNYYRGRAKILISSLVDAKENQVFTTKQLALQDLEKAVELNTKNLVTIRNSIPLYYFLAAKDLTKPASKDNIDPDFLPITKSFYDKVKDYSSNDVGVYALLAKYEKRLGLDEGYKYSVEKIEILRPDLLDWYPGLIE